MQNQISVEYHYNSKNNRNFNDSKKEREKPDDYKPYV